MLTGTANLLLPLNMGLFIVLNSTIRFDTVRLAARAARRCSPFVAYAGEAKRIQGNFSRIKDDLGVPRAGAAVVLEPDR